MNIQAKWAQITKALQLGSSVVIATIGLWGSAPQALAQATCGTTTTPATTYGQVKQSISFTSAGTYRVWSRIKAPTTANNAYYFQIDNGCAAVVGDAASIPANTWTWVNYTGGNTTAYLDISVTA